MKGFVGAVLATVGDEEGDVGVDQEIQLGEVGLEGKEWAACGSLTVRVPLSLGSDLCSGTSIRKSNVG